VVAEGDGTLTPTWTPSDGSQFSGYVAKITAPSSAAQTSGALPASARSFQFSGLTNETEHTITIEGTTV